MSSHERLKSPLAAFLRVHGAAILSAWERAERRPGSSSRWLDPGVLRNHLPAILERVAERVEAAVEAASRSDGEPASSVGVEESAANSPEPMLAAHAIQRLREGFDLEDVAAEYGQLRRCMLRLLDEAEVRPSWIEMAALHDALDLAIIHPAASIAAARERALGSLDRISIEGLGGSQIDKPLRRLLEVLVESARAVDWAAILLLEGEALRVRTSIGVDEAVWKARTYRLARGFVGRIVRERQPVALRSAALDPLATDAGGAMRQVESGFRAERAGGELHALYGAPLLFDGRLLGVAVMSSRRVTEYTEWDRALFRKVADRATAFVTQTQLREQVASERGRLEVLLRHLPVGVAISEAPTGTSVLGNRRIEEILRGRDEIAATSGYHPTPIDLGEDDRARDPLTRALAGVTTLSEEIEFLRGDGEARQGVFSAAPVRDTEGRVGSAVMIVDDVTERRRAEQARELLVEASAILADSLDDSATLEQVVRLGGERFADFCVLDLLEEGKLRRLAASAREPTRRALLPRILQHPPDIEARNPLTDALERSEITLVARVTDPWLQQIARGREHLDALRQLAARSAILAPLVARGRKLGLLTLATTARDFTQEDVEVVEELARLSALGIESTRLYREAREAVRAREEFVSIAAHELRTPLAALDIQVQSLRRGLGRGRMESERLERGLETAARQCQRLARMVDDLFDLSRLSSGRLVLEKERVDLSELAGEILHGYDERLAAAGCTASFSSAGPVIGIWDRLRIEQVVTNLLVNVIKYAPGAPVEVTVAAEGSLARLSVRDHGPGVPPADRTRIFAPFQRASGSHANRSLGLGLYITRQIIEAHGGTIEVLSDEGKGATFVVWLPREAPAP